MFYRHLLQYNTVFKNKNNIVKSSFDLKVEFSQSSGAFLWQIFRLTCSKKKKPFVLKSLHSSVDFSHELLCEKLLQLSHLLAQRVELRLQVSVLVLILDLSLSLRGRRLEAVAGS